MDGKIALIAGVVFGGVLLAGAATGMGRGSAPSSEPGAAATTAVNSGGPADAVAVPLSSEALVATRDREHSPSRDEAKSREQERESDDD